VFNAASTPPLVTGDWVSYDILLSDFTGLAAKDKMGQLIISGDPNTVYVDNIYFYTTASSVETVDATIPVSNALGQNYPNPFNPSTKIRFSLTKADNVKLTVYNMTGQKVATLLNEFRNAGTHEVTFNAENLPSGTYMYAISAGNFRSFKKMILIK
jgi:hypothetical protein